MTDAAPAHEHVRPLRKSVPLTPDDADGVLRLQVDLVWQRAAFDLAGIRFSDRPSEAEAIRALVEVGRTALASRVSDAALAEGYAELAAAQPVQDEAVNRAVGRRAARRVG